MKVSSDSKKRVEGREGEPEIRDRYSQFEAYLT
jgi:hypothetical protein